MKAFIVHSPKNSSIEEVENPFAQVGQVVVQVARVGVCGTDVEFFNGEMPYLHSGQAKFPMRLGHEWCGTVISVGSETDKAWIGKRVTGDTMLGCGKCKRCLSGIQHLCAERNEIGVRNGWSGALAEQLLVPVTALHELPDSINDTMGALIEPGGNALRAAQASLAEPGKTILIYGSGTIGLLASQFAMAMGATVHMISLDAKTLALAKDLGVREVSREFIPSKDGFDAVIDATNSNQVPGQAVEAVEPGGRLVLIGFAGSPSLFDSRRLVLKNVTAVGILSGSPALKAVIGFYSSGKIDPQPLVAATVGLALTADVLTGKKISGASNGPKILIDPTL